MTLFHSKGFCLYSLPNSENLQLCSNDAAGNDDGLDFILAPFLEEQTSIQFFNPSIVETDISQLEDHKHEITALLQFAKLNTNEVRKDQFVAGIEKAQSDFDGDGFIKVIAARNKLEKKPSNFNPLDFFNKLRLQQPSNFSYLFCSPVSGTWLGTTPELLLEQNQNKVRTMSLAGTRNAQDQNWTSKELDEQQIVTNFIQTELKKLGAVDLRVDTKRNVQSAHIQHLCNDITATLGEEIPPISVLKCLHPTPAVSGYGKSKAIQFINREENFDRAFYSGYIGLMNKASANLFVNLRCMRVGRDSIELFAGAGITSDSNPIKEFEETETKLETLLQHF
jgi:isochorismate synthase